ncbi:MAG: bifunctional riboflavin kinase/FAD synthetase [Coriobacteriia bacterium]|nr:bifunctional riboflavin kinase/FAD synthetase [Coriobacteriia bacterium]
MGRTVLWTPDMASLGPACAAVGVFDGVHVGHQALVRDAVRIAAAEECASVVLTFDRDPDQVVSPASAAPQLLDLEDKLTYLAELGPDAILVIPFDSSVAAMAPLVFLDRVLLGALRPVSVVVGYDFRFGHRAEGDVDTLVRYGREHDFTVIAHDLVSVDAAPVTSTRVRRLVASGDVAGAARLLGRPHRVKGDVVHGRAAGASLGAPTANLAVGPFAAVPADGVYAGRVSVDGTRYAAGISVGVPPTFPGATADFEAHLIDFDGDLYGRSVTVEFVERLRDQRAFDSEHELADAIAADLDRVRGIVGE